MRNAEAPIGVFDSGFGGLTVVRSILDQLPHESVIYLADTARQPYGPEPIAHVRQYALECLDALVERNVKMLVIACNSASAAMLHDARERYDLPVVEVIRPAVRSAMAATTGNRVGVISTRATAQSGAYEDSFAAAPNVSVTTVACPRFVEFVEAGITSGPDLLNVARGYLQRIADARVDTLILGCTHYPLLAGAISYVMQELSPDHPVTLISSAQATAYEVYRKLTDLELLKSTAATPSHQFLTTGDPVEFAPLARRFLGPEAETATQIRVEQVST